MKKQNIYNEILAFFRKDPGSFVSGEDISDKLKVSRASVWKYINKLREDGYLIDAVPHLGYRLKSVPDKLLAGEIRSGLKTKRIGKSSIYHFESIGSTNDEAYKLAEKGEPEGTLVVAETQTRGKGRVGRKWTSPKGYGLYMSLILRPDMETDEIPAITLIAATSAARTINDMCRLKAGIKWPNDILINGKKLGGVLTEIKAQPDTVDFLVLGIGININTPKSRLPDTGTSLKEEVSSRVDRAEFTRSFLVNLEDEYDKLKKKGFAALRDDCRRVSSVLGRRVKITEHHKKSEGVAVDIDEKGALILRLDDGSKKRVFSGDVVMCR